MKYLVSFALLLFLISPLEAEVLSLNVDVNKSEVTWLGKKVAGQHDGVIKLKNGMIKLSDGLITSGVFTLDMKSIENKDLESPKYKAKLEKHLKSKDFFNVESYSEGTFKILSSSKKSETKQEVQGELTIKDQTNRVTFDVDIDKEGSAYKASAKFYIDRTKWNIKYHSGKFFDPAALGDKLIYDDIEIALKIVAKQ